MISEDENKCRDAFHKWLKEAIEFQELDTPYFFEQTRIEWTCFKRGWEAAKGEEQ